MIHCSRESDVRYSCQEKERRTFCCAAGLSLLNPYTWYPSSDISVKWSRKPQAWVVQDGVSAYRVVDKRYVVKRSARVRRGRARTVVNMDDRMDARGRNEKREEKAITSATSLTETREVTLGYKKITNPFSPAKALTSTSSSELSLRLIFGNVSPNLSAPLDPVSAGADLGASASFSAAAADSSVWDFGVTLAFFDAGPDFGGSVFLFHRK